MSETRDEAGQFVSAEPLYGLEGVEHDAGYVPLPEDPRQEEQDHPDELTLGEAREKIFSTPEGEIETYVPGAELPDNMTMTTEQVAKVLQDRDDADAKQADQGEIEQTQKEVDALRQPEAKPAEFDVEKALENPKLKEAFEAKFNEAEKVKTEADSARRQFVQAIDIANKFAQASLVDKIPELADVPADQWEGVLSQILQQQPERFTKDVIGTMQRVNQLQAVEGQRQQLKQWEAKQQFEVYSKEQNEIFAEKTKAVPAAQMRAIEAEVPKMLEEYGATPAQFLEAIGTNTTFPRAAAEMIMVDAARYRLMMQAPKAIAARSVPSVQRPGTFQPRQAPADANIAALDRELTRTGSLKVAEKLLKAKLRAS